MLCAAGEIGKILKLLVPEHIEPDAKVMIHLGVDDIRKSRKSLLDGQGTILFVHLAMSGLSVDGWMTGSLQSYLSNYQQFQALVEIAGAFWHFGHVTSE